MNPNGELRAVRAAIGPQSRYSVPCIVPKQGRVEKPCMSLQGLTYAGFGICGSKIPSKEVFASSATTLGLAILAEIAQSVTMHLCTCVYIYTHVYVHIIYLYTCTCAKVYYLHRCSTNKLSSMR